MSPPPPPTPVTNAPLHDNILPTSFYLGTDYTPVKFLFEKQGASLALSFSSKKMIFSFKNVYFPITIPFISGLFSLLFKIYSLLSFFRFDEPQFAYFFPFKDI